MLKPQDVIVAVKLLLTRPWPTYAGLGRELEMSQSEAHASVRRLAEARLVDPFTQTVRRDALRNFLVHGVPYVFPAYPMEITPGLPTAWAADVLHGRIPAPEHTLPPVWAVPNGPVKGVEIPPLYAHVPNIVRHDTGLYCFVALIDVLRLGRARERAIAVHELDERLNQLATSEESVAR